MGSVNPFQPGVFNDAQDIVKFNILGGPPPRARIRFAHGRPYDPQTSIMLAYKKVAHAMFCNTISPHFADGVPLKMELNFLIERPPSHYRGKSGRLRAGVPSFPRRGDIDNMVKFALDGLEGVLFYNDSDTQINIHSTYARNLNLGLHAST
jgi:Holliday junction resolvase RusA-like endonuclease